MPARKLLGGCVIVCKGAVLPPGFDPMSLNNSAFMQPTKARHDFECYV